MINWITSLQIVSYRKIFRQLETVKKCIWRIFFKCWQVVCVKKSKCFNGKFQIFFRAKILDQEQSRRNADSKEDNPDIFQTVM